MRRRIFWAIIGVPSALIVIGAGAAFSLQMTRHMISGLWNMPDRLPALSTNSQVHYQPGAEDFARDVAALYPDAIARVEAMHGRRFAHPVTVGAYATPEAYAAANGQGSDVPVGVTFAGRVNLSPKLFWPQHQRLRAILTHELSHAHINGWIGAVAYIHLPNWFKEGLAVMVSEGGGAESVSEPEARAAIQRGEHFLVEETGSLRTLVGVKFTQAPRADSPSHVTLLAYRQAGMFVRYLHDSDAPAFQRMLQAVLDGRPCVEAVRVGYRQDIQALWRTFARRS